MEGHKGLSGNKQSLGREFCVVTSQRILWSPMPNEHPVIEKEKKHTQSKWSQGLFNLHTHKHM